MGCKILEIPFYFPDREKGDSKMSFAIQREAAVRVWQLPGEYKDISGGYSNG
jgi:dolichol-phosphate mannosyltransferase